MRGPKDSDQDKLMRGDGELDSEDEEFDGIIRIDEWGNSWDESGEFGDMDFRLVDE